MKFSVNEAFKSAFKIYCQNFFVVFCSSVFCVILLMGMDYYLFYVLHHSVHESTIGYSSVRAMTWLVLTYIFLHVFKGYKINFKDCFGFRSDFKKVIYQKAFTRFWCWR